MAPAESRRRRCATSLRQKEDVTETKKWLHRRRERHLNFCNAR